jgi:hypothetical protein
MTGGRLALDRGAPPERPANRAVTAQPDRGGLVLGGGRRAIAPDLEAPYWREADGTRHSYQTLRLGLGPGPASELRRAHAAAIRAIAAAALEAGESGDRRGSRRLAAAAGRLCGEITGLWPPTALEIPK